MVQLALIIDTRSPSKLGSLMVAAQLIGAGLHGEASAVKMAAPFMKIEAVLPEEEVE
jgi:hypothetical protein